MESACSNWLKQDMFHRQRASFELGFLTEELISRQELLRILTAGRRVGFSSPTVKWYYENIRVSPTPRMEHQLIVRVRLPLTDSVSCKTYYIWSGPIPGISSNYNVQLQIAAHTLTGSIFQPTTCHWKKPMFCRAGATDYRTRFKCPKEFLLGQSLRESVTLQNISVCSILRVNAPSLECSC